MIHKACFERLQLPKATFPDGLRGSSTHYARRKPRELMPGVLQCVPKIKQYQGVEAPISKEVGYSIYDHLQTLR
jgi:hypothetical protein